MSVNFHNTQGSLYNTIKLCHSYVVTMFAITVGLNIPYAKRFTVLDREIKRT